MVHKWRIVDWDGKEWLINRQQCCVRDPAGSMQQLFTLLGCHLLLFKVCRGTLPFCLSHSSLRFPCVYVVCLYLAWVREESSIWPENQRSKSFTSYTTSPINWGMGKPPQSSVRDLLQCWVRRQPLSRDMLPLELCSAKSLYFVHQGARFSANMPGNTALCEPVDLQSERPSMNGGATFYKHSKYMYLLHSKSVFILLYLSTWLQISWLLQPMKLTNNYSKYDRLRHAHIIMRSRIWFKLSDWGATLPLFLARVGEGLGTRLAFTVALHFKWYWKMPSTQPRYLR